MGYLKEFKLIGIWELNDRYKSNKSLESLNLKGINFKIEKEFNLLKNVIYIFKTDEEVLYVGETTSSLKSRFESYRYGFDVLNDTDNRVKKRITEILEKGMKIDILCYQPKTSFHFVGKDIEIPLSKPIEEFLISKINPTINRKSKPQNVNHDKFMVNTVDGLRIIKANSLNQENLTSNKNHTNMGMPNRIVFIRHGESEANVVQKRDKLGEDVTSQKNLAIRERIDYKQRLSKKGIEQAIQARDWINSNVADISTFDTYFVSSFYRARETAATVSKNHPEIQWEIDDRLAERNWGIHGPLTIAQRLDRHVITERLMVEDPFHTSFEGGESVWGVKNERIRNLMNTWAREQSGKKIIVVTHGDLIRAARVGFERILPEEFEAIENNPIYKVRNCQILEYSRLNPFTGQDEGKIKWRRITNPTESETSPDNGEWVELRGKPKMNAIEILEKIEKDSPSLIK